MSYLQERAENRYWYLSASVKNGLYLPPAEIDLKVAIVFVEIIVISQKVFVKFSKSNWFACRTNFPMDSPEKMFENLFGKPVSIAVANPFVWSDFCEKNVSKHFVNWNLPFSNFFSNLFCVKSDPVSNSQKCFKISAK